jgi:LPXTG-motif cell wall-anchored protein
MRQFHKPCRRGLGLKNALSIILSICLISFGGLIPQAAVAAVKSVSIHTVYTDKDKEVPISGVTLEILQVAGPGSNGFELTPEFAASNLQISDLTKEKSIKAAVSADKWATAHDLKGWKETSTSDGLVTFDGISDGIWLIREAARSGEAQKYDSYDPFLVTVTGSSSSMSVYPKSEVTPSGEPDKPPVPDTPDTPDTPTPDTPTPVRPNGGTPETPTTTPGTPRTPSGFIPSTGDENGATAFLLLFIGSAGALGLLTRRKLT